MSDDELIRRGDAKAWFAQYPYVKGLRDAIDAIPAAPFDAMTVERAALVAETTNNGETAKAIARAIRALAPEPAHVTAARVVKIKPLEWEQSAGGVWTAQTGFGSHYSVVDSQWFYGPMTEWVWVDGGDDAAKAAAQADYEARIRSAIVEGAA